MSTANREAPAVACRVPARRRWDRWRWPAVSTASAAVFLLLRTGVTESGAVSALFRPSPGKVAEAGASLLADGTLTGDVLASLRRVLVGVLATAAVGVPSGTLLAQPRWAKAICDPLLSLVRPLPSMAWIPLTLLWLGITETQKYAIVFMGCVAR